MIVAVVLFPTSEPCSRRRNPAAAAAATAASRRGGSRAVGRGDKYDVTRLREPAVPAAGPRQPQQPPGVGRRDKRGAAACVHGAHSVMTYGVVGGA